MRLQHAAPWPMDYLGVKIIKVQQAQKERAGYVPLYCLNKFR